MEVDKDLLIVLGSVSLMILIAGGWVYMLCLDIKNAKKRSTKEFEEYMWKQGLLMEKSTEDPEAIKLKLVINNK